MSFSKEQLWHIYVTKNPNFQTEGATMSAAGLRKFFDTTWDAAHARGLENGKVLGAEQERKIASSNVHVENLFDKFFNGSK